MRGLVNYYVDEDEENYAVVRGEEDVYKFQLSQTGVELHDPVKEDIPLEFKENGLTFTTHSSQVNLQTGFDEETRRSYERELEDLLKTKLGNVSEVEFFDHNIRSEWTECSRNSPAYHVHGDFAPEAAVARVKAVLGEERGAEWCEGHVGILNVWRPINTVEKSPLAFIDVSSVDDQKDRVKVRILYGERVGVMQGVKESRRHKWLCIEKMRPDQVWIFSQFDSRTNICVPHSAVQLTNTPPDARPRSSIETRCLIRYSD